MTLRPGSTLEVATFDVSICQLDGTEVVRVEGYTMRRAAGELAAGLQADAPAVPSRRTSPIDDALRVGMTPDEAILAATIGGATALRRDDIGRLAPGRRADLIVLDAPSPIHFVYRPGVPLVAATVIRGVAVFRRHQ